LPRTPRQRPVGCELKRLELTSAGFPTPRSCSRPLSPRTEVRREEPERFRHRQTTAFGTRAEARAFDPKGNASFTPDTNTSSHWATRAGRHLRQARLNRQVPEYQPGTHTSTGHRPRGFRQNIAEYTITDGDRRRQPEPAGDSPSQLRSPRPSALDHASQ